MLFKIILSLFLFQSLTVNATEVCKISVEVFATSGPVSRSAATRFCLDYYDLFSDRDLCSIKQQEYGYDFVAKLQFRKTFKAYQYSDFFRWYTSWAQEHISKVSQVSHKITFPKTCSYPKDY